MDGAGTDVSFHTLICSFDYEGLTKTPSSSGRNTNLHISKQVLKQLEGICYQTVGLRDLLIKCKVVRNVVNYIHFTSSNWGFRCLQTEG